MSNDNIRQWVFRWVYNTRTTFLLAQYNGIILITNRLYILCKKFQQQIVLHLLSAFVWSLDKIILSTSRACPSMPLTGVTARSSVVCIHQCVFSYVTNARCGCPWKAWKPLFQVPHSIDWHVFFHITKTKCEHPREAWKSLNLLEVMKVDHIDSCMFLPPPLHFQGQIGIWLSQIVNCSQDCNFLIMDSGVQSLDFHT